MVSTGGRDPSSTGLREREHPDDVNDLLQANATRQSNSGEVVATVGVPGSSRGGMSYSLVDATFVESAK